MMKKSFAWLVGALLAASLGFTPLLAQQDDTAEVKIKTSSQCDMCKKRIEKVMGLEKGVKSATLNLDDHTLALVYKKSKTSPEKLRATLASIGYDADGQPADKKAHDKLPDCCQKGGHDGGKGH